ncbi:MAG TPA: hypothetical protein VIR33_08460 [Thermopolyspora sp.]|jgi:hypothetical protein
MQSTMRHFDCPRCGTTLDDGPILYRCARCRRSIYAADLDTEFGRPFRTAA